MSEMVEVKVPDIGDIDSVEIIEVLVSIGDQRKFLAVMRELLKKLEFLLVIQLLRVGWLR